MTGETGPLDHGGSRLRWVLWGGAGLLLLAPLIAMRFTTEVNWTAFDFAVFGGMLLGTGVALEVAVRLLRRPLGRWIAILGILAVFLLVWAQGAVGLF